MSDETKIEPALSAEEWERRSFDIALGCGSRPQEALALANASLPDDSPYKITRADVEALISCVERCDADEQHMERQAIRARGRSPFILMQSSRRVRAARRLASKLEALLPPE